MIANTLVKIILKNNKNLFFKQFRAFQTLNDTSLLDEDHIAVQNLALDFANNKLMPFAAEWDLKSHFPKDIIKEGAQLGFGSIYISPDYGGVGLGRLAASIVFEALSTACVATSAYYSIHTMNCWLVEQYGNEQQKNDILKEMTPLNLFSSYCLTEPNSGSDAGAMKTFAKKDGSDYVINGSKCFISCGGISDLYFLMCLTGEKQKSCIIVPKDAKGISFGSPEKKMGWKSSPTTTITFEDCRVPQRNLLFKEGEGFNMAKSALYGGRVNIASCSLGAAAYSIGKAKKWMSERKQFKKHLNEFQHLQFTLADMATDLVASRLIVRDAAIKVQNNHKDKEMYSSMAKLFATEKCYNIVDKALQIHGGYGYIQEGGIERYLRDIRVNRILEGTNEIMRAIISKQIIQNL